MRRFPHHDFDVNEHNYIVLRKMLHIKYCELYSLYYKFLEGNNIMDDVKIGDKVELYTNCIRGTNKYVKLIATVSHAGWNHEDFIVHATTKEYPYLGMDRKLIDRKTFDKTDIGNIFCCKYDPNPYMVDLI